jgi:hypothetical protein
MPDTCFIAENVICVEPTVTPTIRGNSEIAVWGCFGGFGGTDENFTILAVLKEVVSESPSVVFFSPGTKYLVRKRDFCVEIWAVKTFFIADPVRIRDGRQTQKVTRKGSGSFSKWRRLFYWWSRPRTQCSRWIKSGMWPSGRHDLCIFDARIKKITIFIPASSMQVYCTSTLFWSALSHASAWILQTYVKPCIFYVRNEPADK